MSREPRLLEFVRPKPVKIGNRSYANGSRDYFPHDEGQVFVDFGWAKDVETGECGTHKPGVHQLQPHNTGQDASAS